MSATVLPFTGEWQGRAKQASTQDGTEARAYHDARLIRAAKSQNDDWTARLLIALLETLTVKQRALLEFRLLGPTLNSESAVQALALVQLASGDKAHRESVTRALSRIAGREAE